MTEIKAIETEYNGYKFRSRLEARWAVFFDNAGIEYQYESEGYELKGGERYLPDFFIPDCHSPFGNDLFVEVKAKEPEEVECKKARQLSEESGIPVLIVSQIPKTCVFQKDAGQFSHKRSDGSEYVANLAGLSTIDKEVFDDTWLFVNGINFDCGVYIDISNPPVSECHNARLTIGLDVIWSHKSYRKARQARFEFGCKG